MKAYRRRENARRFTLYEIARQVAYGRGAEPDVKQMAESLFDSIEKRKA